MSGGQAPQTVRFEEAVKRVFDIISSFFGLVFLSPILAICAVCIRLDSRGPVLYRSIRAGRFGKPFCIFKLRTMVVNAEKLGGAETAADHGLGVG